MIIGSGRCGDADDYLACGNARPRSSLKVQPLERPGCPVILRLFSSWRSAA
jgi:hypothetical protein